MNIARYMKAHEASVKQQLLTGNSCTADWDRLRELHSRTIAYLQHERLVHLLVMLAVGAFLLATTIISLIRPCPQLLVLIALFLILFVPYLFHYFFLENTVQRWYQLMDDIERRRYATLLGQ